MSDKIVDYTERLDSLEGKVDAILEYLAKNDARWEKNDARWEKNDARWDENDTRWEHFVLQVRQMFEEQDAKSDRRLAMVLEHMDKKFEIVAEAFSGQRDRHTKLETRVDGVETKQETIDIRVSVLEKSRHI